MVYRSYLVKIFTSMFIFEKYSFKSTESVLLHWLKIFVGLDTEDVNERVGNLWLFKSCGDE